MKQTSFEEFVELAQRGTFVPVCREIMADLLTPVSAFLKIAEHSDYAFLLESVEGGEHVGRYSFLGKDPFLVAARTDGRNDDRASRRAHRATRAVRRRAAWTDGGVHVAVRAGSAAFHRRRGRLSRLRRGRMVRAGRATRQAAARPRPGRLHGVRHGARVRPRQTSHPRDRECASARRARICARFTTSPAPRSTSSSASSSAICPAASGASRAVSTSRPT